MKTFSYGIAALLMAGAAPSAHAVSIILGYGSHNQNPGGAYAVSPIASGNPADVVASQTFVSSIAAHYQPEALHNGGFETFCIEYNEHFSPGSAYEVAVSPRALSAASPDPVSVGTGYLYSLYATGMLDDLVGGFSYTDAGSMGKLQSMIWYLEDEGGALNPGTFDTLLTTEFGGAANWKLDLAASNSQSGMVTAASYGVAALNVGGAPSFRNQDQLVFQGLARQVPEGGGTLVLLGLAVGGLGLLKRRLG